MENKKVTKRSKAQAKKKSIRVSLETSNKADRILDLANEKKAGAKIKLDQVFSLALDLINEIHIEKLKMDSLKNSDRQELLRQKYIEQFGQISKEEFIGFTMTDAYSEFLKSQSSASSLSIAV
jgi:hypothetical protein